MDLFITYQIPSDLLAFDENNNVQDGVLIVGSGPAEKVSAVKKHVAAMYEMINKSKEEEIQGRKMEEAYANPRKYERQSTASSLASEYDDRDEEECMMDFALEAECAAPARRARGFGGALQRASSFKMAEKASTMVRSAARMASAAMPNMVAEKAAVVEDVSIEQNTTEQPKVERSQSQQHRDHDAVDEGLAVERDYTQVPKEMDARFETLDVDGQVRPTIINPGPYWEKSSQKALLAKSESSVLDSDAQKKEKDAAFDLLDALTKSGAIPVEHASLHVVVAATHCFDKSVLETIVQDNVNPIDKVERSTLIMATTVHQQPAETLIKDAQMARVKDTSPMLFAEALS
jgi:hypothetical protein